MLLQAYEALMDWEQPTNQTIWIRGYIILSLRNNACTRVMKPTNLHCYVNMNEPKGILQTKSAQMNGQRLMVMHECRSFEICRIFWKFYISKFDFWLWVAVLPMERSYSGTFRFHFANINIGPHNNSPSSVRKDSNWIIIIFE